MGNSGQNNNFRVNIFSPDKKNGDVNPFNTDFSRIDALPSEKSQEPVRRINGYDSAILNKTAFDDTESKNLSIEYRIKEKETVIKELDARIKSADNYGTSNEVLGLKAKRNRISQELNTLRRQQLNGYNNIAAGNFTRQKFKSKMPLIFKIQNFISRKILARFSKKIHSVISLTDSLEKLYDINNSVNKLIDMNNIPYGEKMRNYEQLTEYLNQAGVLHSKISRTLGKKL